MNRLCGQLGIKYPIFQGGMGNISNAILTSAVSEAGGLGTIGAGTMTSGELEEIIQQTKEMTDKPFAVNIAIGVSPYVDELIELLIKHRVPVVSLSAGDPTAFIERFHNAGIKVVTVVGSVRHAQKAEAAGSDVIVAEGYEAAGINSNYESTTLTLIPQIVDKVTVPVVAAGGIADGRGLAAMLALGASGVQIGTRFIVTKEAPFSKEYKHKILSATDTDTVIVGRTVKRVRRVLKSPYSKKLLEFEGSPDYTLAKFSEFTSEKFHKIGAVDGNLEEGFINGGQISGIINDIPTVKELVERMIAEAELVMNSLIKKL
ncbi:nitronate monooxygenase [Schinkia azotoformans]|uniref:Probable nitronate monooxygenase n=1 Tax=Schinkia azotoformans LMG 9581 TaxID=1131731 RepID=K6D5I3_SCHAZ|nr:nitronate monooxygenase [Schinkia azotoformans]EKN63534.1 2-nitropropane dioxygenase [Schinkia azotoformans LMG 9581]MEC1638834.1 nitronate monooxygenase [Schinkia azotoformans]MEC1720860.1 nitronate monooxygenase [Schinkia azotoformans]MEC1946799.1 nitronate monooxygenase [Schinkia azotoformans]MED4412111.1 nitronate monooxygenase [Schinkia azotoformans]